MSCGCSGTKTRPSGDPQKVLGEIGLLKVVQVSEEHYDVFGEVTDALYPFSVRSVRYVDTRDAVYLLGKDFELA